MKIRYGKGYTATFVHQIIISGTNGSAFSGSGDSGSLIVTDNSTHNPVGLLFAGSTSTTIANPGGDAGAAGPAARDDAEHSIGRQLRPVIS